MSEKPKDFSDILQNAVAFPPHSGGKVLAALAERLAMQGVWGIRSHARRAAAPSSSPAITWADSSQPSFSTSRRLDFLQAALSVSAPPAA